MEGAKAEDNWYTLSGNFEYALAGCQDSSGIIRAPARPFTLDSRPERFSADQFRRNQSGPHVVGSNRRTHGSKAGTASFSEPKHFFSAHDAQSVEFCR